MKIQIQETAVIRPLKQPFDHDHTLSLSHLDTDRNLLVTLRYLRVYAHHPNQQQADPFHVIAAALSAALVPYYPFSASLIHRQSDGRLELHCRAGDGVPVVRASVDCSLSHIDHLNADDKFADELAPDPSQNQGPIRPMVLQVTRFNCGGFVLGAAIHHAITDGLGATLFFEAMAELARGSGQTTIDPVWDRTTLLGPRDPPRVVFPIHKCLRLDKDFSPYSGSSQRLTKKWYYDVKESCLDELKCWLHKQSGSKYTTFEALGAFIWRARTSACEVPKKDEVTFVYSVNIRKTVNPPLPIGYWGNGCVPMCVRLTAEEVAEQPLWKTADLIKKSKCDATSEYVSSFVDFQEMHYEEGVSVGRRVSGFTDWRHLGHSKVDFGWGGPVAVVPLSRELLGSAEACFLLPGKEGVVRVLVHLEEGVVVSFGKEMDGLGKMDGGLHSAI